MDYRSWEKELFAKYPIFFGERNNEKSQMRYGILCESGWKDLIEKVASAVEKKNNDEKTKIFIKAKRIMELDGLLKIDINVLDNDVLAFIYNIEKESEGVCEICSAPGLTVNVDGMSKVRCKKCWK